MIAMLYGCLVSCRSQNLNMYEELYFNITSNSTGVAYNLTRPPIPWNYTQCAIADSQFFWAGQTTASVVFAVPVYTADHLSWLHRL